MGRVHREELQNTKNNEKDGQQTEMYTEKEK